MADRSREMARSIWVSCWAAGAGSGYLRNANSTGMDAMTSAIAYASSFFCSSV